MVQIGLCPQNISKESPLRLRGIFAGSCLSLGRGERGICNPGLVETQPECNVMTRTEMIKTGALLHSISDPQNDRHLFSSWCIYFMNQTLGKEAKKIIKRFVAVKFESKLWENLGRYWTFLLVFFCSRILLFIRSWFFLELNALYFCFLGRGWWTHHTTQQNLLPAITDTPQQWNKHARKLCHNIISLRFSLKNLWQTWWNCCYELLRQLSGCLLQKYGNGSKKKRGRYRNILLWCFRHCPAVPATSSCSNLQHSCRHQGD